MPPECALEVTWLAAEGTAGSPFQVQEELRSLENTARLPSVADFFAEQLARWGVRFVFGLPGTDNLPFLDAVHRHPQLRFYGVRHEQAAALMASAVAKLTGEMAVCTATSGPGVANLLNGLGDAYADGVPVLAITGQVERRRMTNHNKQYVDQQGLLRPVTGFSALLTHPHAAGPLLGEAMRTALFHGSTAHVSVPRDLWQQPTAARILGPEPYLFTPRRSPHHVLQEAARILSDAERPALVVGLGCARAIPEVLQLAERLRAPIIHTLPVAGKIPWQHPLSVGGLGEGGSEAASRLLREADWIFRIGANWWPETFVPVQGPRIMALDTRPDRLGSGAGAHFGLVGDCQELLPELESLLTPRPRPAWEQRILFHRLQWTESFSREAAENGRGGGIEDRGGGIHPARIMAELNPILPHDAILCLDVGDHVIWFNRHFQGSGQDILLSGTWRTMGFALPAALAARLAFPYRKVVAITGDGGFTMSLSELGTARQHRIPVTIVLFHNGLYATEAHQARLEGYHAVGTRLENPDFGKLISSWGGVAYPVRRPDQIRPQFLAALESSTVSLVDIPTRAVMPPTAGRRAAQDVRESPSVEEPATVAGS